MNLKNENDCSSHENHCVCTCLLISCLHHSIFITNRKLMVIDLQKVGVLLQLDSNIEIRKSSLKV